MIKKIHLYWHTIRYLRVSQIYARLKHNILFPAIDYSQAPELRPAKKVWVEPLKSQPSLVSPYTFKFLNYENSLKKLGWDSPYVDKLWRYNQHYFDDLNAHRAGFRNSWHQDLIRTWVQDNPPARGVGWDSYPISLRVVNWIKWSLGGGRLT